jgi:23S rRNA (cytidine1920-2'-O)/16S rRNA (cytidine1409-2'-O)-methyltransferase
LNLEYSPIKGPEGNIEYLVHIKKTNETGNIVDTEKVDVDAVVTAAHSSLDK